MAIPVFLQRLTTKEEKGADTPSWDGCSAGEAIDRQRAMVAAIGRKTATLNMAFLLAAHQSTAEATLAKALISGCASTPVSTTPAASSSIGTSISQPGSFFSREA